MYFKNRFQQQVPALQTSAVGVHAPAIARVRDGSSTVLDRPRRRVGVPGANRNRPVGGALKRATDIVMSLTAIVLLAPIMLLIAVLIRLTMGGPIIFAQRRIGFDGSVFVCYKFRTMIPNAEEALERHLAADPEAAREWRETRKLRRDPRINCAGSVLRKSSLDELPQLFNVLRGDMSMIGPRPVVPAEIQCYGPHARECLQARPGLSGLWQVSGRNRVTYARRVALDRHYVRNWSIALDLWVLIKTIPAVLSVRDTA